MPLQTGAQCNIGGCSEFSTLKLNREKFVEMVKASDLCLVRLPAETFSIFDGFLRRFRIISKIDC